MAVPRGLNIRPQLQHSILVFFFPGSLVRPQQRKSRPLHIIIIIMGKGTAIISTQTAAEFSDTQGSCGISRTFISIDKHIHHMGLPPIIEVIVRTDMRFGKPLIHNTGLFIVIMLLKAALEPVRTRLPVRLC